MYIMKAVDYEIPTFVGMTVGVVYCLLNPHKARVRISTIKKYT
jgi:hypothetical protein